MTLQAKWAERVAEWRESGLSADAFCQDKDYSGGALRGWACKLRRVGGSKEVRLARIVRASDPLAEDTPVLLETGAVRIAVRRGFDPEVLRAVLAVVTETP